MYMNNLILRDLNYGVYVIGSKDRERNVECIARDIRSNKNPSNKKLGFFTVY